jgi:hypothetical protein
MSDDTTRHAEAGIELRSERSVEEKDLDEILADSFPASDPPPWTLGVREKKPDAAPDQREGQLSV